jgi:hypothetical protein
MRKKSVVLTLLVVSILATVLVAYSGGWGGVSATGGSIHVEGYGYGVGQADTAQISATVTGYIVCTNNGMNIAPGQTYTKSLPTLTDRFEGSNGKFFFHFDWEHQLPGDPPAEGQPPTDSTAWGCPNSNWTVDYLHHYLTFTLKAVEDDGTVNDKITATFSCVMEPPALSGEYECTQL